MLVRGKTPKTPNLPSAKACAKAQEDRKQLAQHKKIIISFLLMKQERIRFYVKQQRVCFEISS